MRKYFVLANETAKHLAMHAIAHAEEGHIVKISPANRSTAQNALLWVLLTQFSEQLEWPVDGTMQKLEPIEWKHLLTAAFRKETQRIAQGINGGMVMLGASTSKMSKREFIEFLDFISSVAVDRGVNLDN